MPEAVEAVFPSVRFPCAYPISFLFKSACSIAFSNFLNINRKTRTANRSVGLAALLGADIFLRRQIVDPVTVSAELDYFARIFHSFILCPVYLFRRRLSMFSSFFLCLLIFIPHIMNNFVIF